MCVHVCVCVCVHVYVVEMQQAKGRDLYKGWFKLAFSRAYLTCRMIPFGFQADSI